MKQALVPIGAAALLLLCGCEFKASIDDDDSAAGNGTAAAAGSGGFTLDTDGFDASVRIPGMKLGSDSMDVDGMKLYPGTVINGMTVRDEEPQAKGGRVTFDFSSDASVANLRDYYLKAAPEAGFSIRQAADGSLAGAKGADSSFTIALRDDGKGGSAGRFTIIGN